MTRIATCSAFGIAMTIGVMGASADEPPRVARSELDKPGYIRIDLGAFSAVGFLGYSVGWAPNPFVALEGGVGVGLSGLQLSAMLKVGGWTTERRVFAGGGVSVGLLPTADQVYPWLNVEGGYEHRWGEGYLVTIALGYTRSLVEIDVVDDPDEWRTGDDGGIIDTIQGRIGFGWTF